MAGATEIVGERVEADAADSSAAGGVRRLERSNGLSFDAGELWEYRELLILLLWRDIKARYKQTFLGAFWAIFRPFISMVIFTMIFSHLAGITPGADVPYPLFVFAGLLIWTYMSSAITSGASSVVGAAGLLSKVYFPRLLVIFSGVATPLVDFVLSFVILAGMFAWYGTVPSWHIVFLPVFVLLAGLLGVGISLWLGPVTVRFRDVVFALPFLIQIWMYATPVIYPVSYIPVRWRWLIELNPASSIINGFRFSLIDYPAPSGASLIVTGLVLLFLIAPGMLYFKSVERRFADII